MKIFDWFKPKSSAPENRFQNAVQDSDEKSPLERYKSRVGVGARDNNTEEKSGLQERVRGEDLSDDPFAKFRTSKPVAPEPEKQPIPPVQDPPLSNLQAEPQEVTLRVHARPISASFGRRLVAEFADFWILFVLVAIGRRIVGQFYSPNSEISGITFLLNGILYSPIFMLAQFLYAGWFLQERGATPGKMLFGLGVVDSDSGQRLSFLRAGFRQVLGKWISGAPLCAGFLLALVRSDRKALHDFIFQSMVVKVSDTKA